MKERILKGSLLLYALLALLLYGNTLSNGYAIDDHYVTNQNALTKRGIKSIPEIFSSYYASGENGNAYEYRPVTVSSFAIEHQLFGQKPFIGHLINVLLYACCLLLLHRFLNRFFPELSPIYRLLAVVLFAVLPLHAEVVANLKNRDILLCFLFTIGAMNRLSAFVETRRYAQLVVALLLAVLGFLSKGDALPFVLLAPLLLYARYRFSLSRAWPVLVLFVAGLAVAVVLRFWLLDASEAHRYFYAYENPLRNHHGLAARLSLGFSSLGFYTRNLILPWDLVCYYGSYSISLGWASGYAIIGCVAALLLLFGCIKTIRKQDTLWKALVLFVIPLSMYLNLVKPVMGIVGDRLAFFASLGFCLLAVLGLRYLQGRVAANGFRDFSLPLKATVILFVGYSAVMVVLRNRDWKDELTLYASDVKKQPSSVKLNVLYGNELIKALSSGRLKQNQKQYVDEAREHLLKAYRMDSGYYNSANSLAYIESGFFADYNEAIHWLYKARRADTINYEIPLNLFLNYGRLQQLDSMEHYFTEALKLNTAQTEQMLQFASTQYRATGQERRGERFLQPYR